jgi:hypothetical protein
MELPEQFIPVMKDFTSDLKTVFPEFAHLWWVYGEDTSEEGWKDLYGYCLKVYPERFFDILYQNEDMFKPDSESNVDFLPRVDFKKLYNCEGVSQQTQQTIWKYLQLLLFMVIGNVKDKSEFGSTMNLFEGIDEEELQSKMQEAMGGLGDFMKELDKNATEAGQDADDDEGNHLKGKMEEMFEEFEKHAKEAGTGDGEAPSFGNTMPRPEDLHEHLKGLFGGKLGGLAQELMEELTEDLHDTLGINPSEFNESSNPADVLKKLMKHPDKLMKLVKKIQNKFQDKMKAGDLSQEDIMREAGDMFRKMKEMGGNSKQMNEMFQNMAKEMGGNMGKNMKVDTNRIDRMMNMQSTKDRIRAKLEKKKQENFVLESTEDPNHKVYRPLDGEKAEKTVLSDEQLNKLIEDIGDIGPSQAKTAPKKKKKKAKK